MKTKELFNDYVIQFKEWLANTKCYEARTVGSRVANIKALGEYYDILKEFSIDECQGIMEELRFSKDDVEPKTSVVIEGNYYNGLATYRYTLKLFVEFLKYINYTAPGLATASTAKFIGSFEEFKRYVGPKCRNEVNIFCKSERDKHQGICEYCGQKHTLQSAHIKERPMIMLDILESNYKVATDLYEVNLEEFFIKFKNEHMPIADHIFFLCKYCHDKLDKYHSITVNDIKNKRIKP